MAVGDTVSALSATNAVLTYQPAAGVEAIISSLHAEVGTTTHPNIYNGTNVTDNTNAVNNPESNFSRYCVNNTLYLRIPAGGVGTFTAYTGMQTK